MANLTFPSNPTNGQKVTVNNKVFVYSNTTSRWTATKLNVFGNLTGDFTISPPELSLSNNTVAFSSTGETVYITYTVDQDVKATIANNGIANSSYANVTLHQTNNTIQITAGTEAFSGANVVLTVTNTRTSNTASISLSGSYQLFTQTTKLFPPDDSTGYNVNVGGTGNQNYGMGLGSAVAGDANTLFVGAPTYDDSSSKASTGAVFWWHKLGGTWTYGGRLQSSTTEASALFGNELAYDSTNDRLLVGAMLEDSQTNGSGTNNGAVYVFDRSGSTYTQTERLKSLWDDNSSINAHRFGSAIAMKKNYAVIGEYDNDASGTAVGWVDLWVESSGSYSRYGLSNPILTANGGTGYGSAGGRWGFDVDIAEGDDEYIIATGIYRADTSSVSDAGAVAMYTATKTGTPTRTKTVELFSPAANTSYFGMGVSVGTYSNDNTKATLAVGAPQEASGNGAVYIYTANATSAYATWTQRQKVVVPNSANSDGSQYQNIQFGKEVAINDDQLIVSATGYDSSSTTNVGRVYVYERSGYGADFIFKERLDPDDDNIGISATSSFGINLSYVSGNTTLFVAASTANNANVNDIQAYNSGTTYVFN